MGEKISMEKPVLVIPCNGGRSKGVTKVGTHGCLLVGSGGRS